MDWTNVLIAIGTLIAGIAALKLMVFSSIEKRLDRIENKLDTLSDRVARIEGSIWRNGTGG